MIRALVPNGVSGEELSRYLRRAWPMLPGHVLRDVLKRKDVRVNGARSGKGTLLRGGDALEIYADEASFSGTLDVLFDDGRLMAVVKPQGLPCDVDADGVGEDTALRRARRLHPQAALCHRLDAQTGGVLLFSLDEETAARAFEDFKEHRLRKTYRAILLKRPPKDDMTLRAYLAKDAHRAEVRVSDRPAPGAKPIVTRVKLLGMKGGLCVAALEPVTGKTHQLRAHMAHIGCPILGDDRYGDRARNREAGFASKLCLWCEEMAIPEGCALEEQVGMSFRADAPEWV